MRPGAAGEVAALLGEARRAARPVPEIPPDIRPTTSDEAYDVQDALHRFLCAASGDGRAGWKVGATTPGMQAYLGVDGPAYGHILTDSMLANGATLPAAEFCNPGIECEIAVRLSADADSGPYDRDRIAAVIGAVFPAIEIVENRYGDFLARGTPTLIADDFFHKACVPGMATEAWHALDLAALAGRTLIDGTERGAGTGADVMGHPLEAVAWLANARAARGAPLSAGDIVLTGSVAPVIWIESFPADARIEIEEIGDVSVRFEADAPP